MRAIRCDACGKFAASLAIDAGLAPRTWFRIVRGTSDPWIDGKDACSAKCGAVLMQQAEAADAPRPKGELTS